ncbi:hypothetical protein K0M31_002971 [Melipona bicolor]|uniref:Uncharacterized protein n=1 Tax=Melipona bicolor TaxID=60889 RepID=A0AA40FZX7_9HYME|nr:hypothetical protein K0M31_002971 [Melipona bicolor]
MLQGSSGKSSNVHQNSLDDSSTQTGPYFDISNSKNVTTILGKTTYLNCRVKNLGNKTQTARDASEVHLATVDLSTLPLNGVQPPRPIYPECLFVRNLRQISATILIEAKLCYMPSGWRFCERCLAIFR